MADPYAGGLPVKNKSRPSARALQVELKRTGFMPSSVALADNYGPQTQAAVARFHNTHTQFRSRGTTNDVQIGRLGWAFLQALPTPGTPPKPTEPPKPSDGEPVHDYRRVQWTGKTINVRTKLMLEEADRLLTAYVWDPYLSQGSYNAGGVAASAGTHDGGGAIDIRASTMTANGAWLCVQALRKAGFAAWYRTPSEGPWAAHIHAIAIGDRDMSSGARAQVASYFAGRNGLANNAKDSAPSWVGRPYPAWAEQYK
jgi:peptidoglycan hydrolase-like protein with peptidoglycan-binding domain